MRWSWEYQCTWISGFSIREIFGLWLPWGTEPVPTVIQTLTRLRCYFLLPSSCLRFLATITLAQYDPASFLFLPPVYKSTSMRRKRPHIWFPHRTEILGSFPHNFLCHPTHRSLTVQLSTSHPEAQVTTLSTFLLEKKERLKFIEGKKEAGAALIFLSIII